MTHLIYFVALIIFVSGFIIMLISDNYFKKIIGLGLFQNSILIFYIALGKISHGTIPIYTTNQLNQVYSAPLNHVLMLTAIVVGFSTLSVALALMYKINEKYKSLSQIEIEKIIKLE